MGGRSDDLSRPRAGAVGVRSCGCRRRSCPGGGDPALAVATICASRPGRDQESGQPAAHQAQLTKRDPYCYAATKLLILKLLVTDFLEYPMMRGGGNRPLVVGTTSARPSGLYSIPGGLSLFRFEHASAPASRHPQIWLSTRPPGNAGRVRRAAAPSRR